MNINFNFAWLHAVLITTIASIVFALFAFFTPSTHAQTQSAQLQINVQVPASYAGLRDVAIVLKSGSFNGKGLYAEKLNISICDDALITRTLVILVLLCVNMTGRVNSS